MPKRDLNAAAFLSCVGPLLETPEVGSMKQWRHHFSITCYQHSLFVSYMAFRIARRLRWDYPPTAPPTRATSAWTTRSSPCATRRHCAPTCPPRRKTPSCPICSPWPSICPSAGKRWWSTSPIRSAPPWRWSTSTRPGGCSAGCPLPPPEPRSTVLDIFTAFLCLFPSAFVIMLQFFRSVKNPFKKSWFLV